MDKKSKIQSCEFSIMKKKDIFIFIVMLILLTTTVFILILEVQMKESGLKNYILEKDRKMDTNILFISYLKLSINLKSK